MKFIKKTIMSFRPLNEIQAHATGLQAGTFKLIRFVRNMMLIAFMSGMLYGAGYLGYQYAREYNPKIVDAAPIRVEVPVEKTLADYPILMKICKAESGMRQLLENGNVIRGKVNPSDIGICQINEPIWNDQARRLGYDIYTQEGNEKMAIWIFINQGTDPWNSSRSGWSK